MVNVEIEAPALWRRLSTTATPSTLDKRVPPRPCCLPPVNHSLAHPFPESTMDGRTRPLTIGELVGLRSASKRCYENGARHGLRGEHRTPSPVLRLTGLSEIRPAHRRDAVQ